MTLIDDEINKAYKLKELFRDFDNISKDEINNYNMEKEMKEVAETLNHWKKEILNSFVWVKNRRISNGLIEGKNYYIKKIIYNGNGMQNFKRTRNRILYSQNKYEKYDLNIEYSDSIKMKSDDLETSFDEETDEFD